MMHDVLESADLDLPEGKTLLLLSLTSKQVTTERRSLLRGKDHAIFASDARIALAFFLFSSYPSPPGMDMRRESTSFKRRILG
jgi:hypothetical protein